MNRVIILKKVLAGLGRPQNASSAASRVTYAIFKDLVETLKSLEKYLKVDMKKIKEILIEDDILEDMLYALYPKLSKSQEIRNLYGFIDRNKKKIAMYVYEEKQEVLDLLSSLNEQIFQSNFTFPNTITKHFDKLFDFVYAKKDPTSVVNIIQYKIDPSGIITRRVGSKDFSGSNDPISLGKNEVLKSETIKRLDDINVPNLIIVSVFLVPEEQTLPVPQGSQNAYLTKINLHLKHSDLSESNSYFENIKESLNEAKEELILTLTHEFTHKVQIDFGIQNNQDISSYFDRGNPSKIKKDVERYDADAGIKDISKRIKYFQNTYEVEAGIKELKRSIDNSGGFKVTNFGEKFFDLKVSSFEDIISDTIYSYNKPQLKPGEVLKIISDLWAKYKDIIKKFQFHLVGTERQIKNMLNDIFNNFSNFNYDENTISIYNIISKMKSTKSFKKQDLMQNLLDINTGIDVALKNRASQQYLLRLSSSKEMIENRIKELSDLNFSYVSLKKPTLQQVLGPEKTIRDRDTGELYVLPAKFFEIYPRYAF